MLLLLRRSSSQRSQITANFVSAIAGLRLLSSSSSPKLSQQQQQRAQSSGQAAAAAGSAKQRWPPRQRQQSKQPSCTLTVAVIGLPNAGKSTLTNRLIGHKISGVSSKRNTTIDPQLGSFTLANSQVLLYDTPGLVNEPGQGNPVERLRSAWATAAVADQLLLIVDAERQFRVQDPALLKLAEQVAAGPPDSLGSGWQQPPAILFLNKQDKLEPNIRATVLQQLRQQLCGIMGFTRVFEGAAMLGQGVPELKAHLAQQAVPGPWLMRAGQTHAATPGELAVELVREKLFRRLNQELPYKLIVRLDAVHPCHSDSKQHSLTPASAGAGSDQGAGTASTPMLLAGTADAAEFEAAVSQAAPLQSSSPGSEGVSSAPEQGSASEAAAGSQLAEPSPLLTAVDLQGQPHSSSTPVPKSGPGRGQPAAQRTRRADVLSGAGLCIRVSVGVANKSMKAIVVGRGGGIIQQYVAGPTQAELSRILKQPVKLVVAVKILG